MRRAGSRGSRVYQMEECSSEVSVDIRRLRETEKSAWGVEGGKEGGDGSWCGTKVICFVRWTCKLVKFRILGKNNIHAIM